ncbi:hypothetical protein L3Q82_004312 [Scortum barcoo]|uniref:Uncharacterized protein n=1 Tax=Scortum barcoo TaxID=214431 RepID=A0ACB8VJN2_9TELE|nr:hypothetical protein L3Q82_004312 [Scortum barcoo]
MNGTAYSNFDNQEHVLKLGETFEKHPKSAYHTVRFNFKLFQTSEAVAVKVLAAVSIESDDFKPASIDTTCEGDLEVGKGEQVTITLPNLEGSSAPVTVFKGSKRPYMKECILIVNHDTGEYRLEKLNSNIAVKKTRAEGSSKIHSRMEQQTSRLSQQIKSNSSSSSSSNKMSAGYKSSPPKEKTSPASPMDDIERELMAEARVMDQLSSGDSSSDSNSSSSSSSDDSSSSSDSEDERTSAPPPAPTNHSMPIINTSASSRHQEGGGGLMNTLSLIVKSFHWSYFPRVKLVPENSSGLLPYQSPQPLTGLGQKAPLWAVSALQRTEECLHGVCTVTMIRRSLLRVGLRLHRAAAAPRAAAGGDAIHRRDASSSTTTSSSTTSTVVGDNFKLKTMEDLGGPSFLHTLYWLFVKGHVHTGQQMQIEHKKIYGPLWKSKYGPLVVVNVASAELIEQVLRQEGRHPIRSDMPHWRGYRELRNQAHGPLTEIGANWYRIRSILNPRMLKPKHVSSYTNTLNEVVADFIDRVAWLRDSTGQGVVVNDLAGELYKFAFEGICSVLFETRMGCLNEEIPEETQKFIFSVGEMFRLSPILILFPRSIWPYLPFWKQFVAVWDHLFKCCLCTKKHPLSSSSSVMGPPMTLFLLILSTDCFLKGLLEFRLPEELVQNKIKEIQDQVHLNQQVEGAYLTHLLLSDQMTVTEILGSITELLLAGVDTTSNTISWSLYLLAKDPEIQEQLYQEIISVCPGDKVPTSDDIAQMPYLKAVIRETLRLYPVVPGNARVTAESEIVVGDHLFPKRTLFHLCHYAVSYDENIFSDPHTFIPERWIRGADDRSKQHPFGSVPFGFGIRACLGRRVAELEMYLLLSRLMKHYEVRPDPAGTTVKPITRTLLCPAQPINLQFLDRRVEPRAAAAVSV